MRPSKQKQPQVKKGLCRVLEHVDVDVYSFFTIIKLKGRWARENFAVIVKLCKTTVWFSSMCEVRHTPRGKSLHCRLAQTQFRRSWTRAQVPQQVTPISYPESSPAGQKARGLWVRDWVYPFSFPELRSFWFNPRRWPKGALAALIYSSLVLDGGSLKETKGCWQWFLSREA